MKPVDSLAEKLQVLLQQGGLPASRLSPRDRSRLQGLLHARNDNRKLTTCDYRILTTPGG